MSYQLILGDNINEMQKIENDCIDLTVTSPPYDNLRTYENSLEWNFKIFTKVAKQLFRITKPGGVVVWVVGDATINGSETGTSFRQALFFKKIGFNLHDTMIYLKTGFNNPSNNRYHQIFEYMFILSKGNIEKFNLIEDRENKYKKRGGRSIRQKNGKTEKGFGGQFLSKYGKRFNVWLINHYGISGGIHPATFPEQLANDHIISWSNENDLVFDPFCGSGTTGKMAIRNNRNFIGIEKVEKYYNISKKRIEEEIEKTSLFRSVS